MDAEQHQLKNLYGSLSELESHTQATEFLGSYATVDYHPEVDSPPRIITYEEALGDAAKQLNNAKSQADALARAEARLDRELVSKVFKLASKVLQANDSITDKQELASAMKSFSNTIASLRKQQDPPRDNRAPKPAPYEFNRAILEDLATKQQIDEGIAAAADNLKQLRVMATAQAKQLTDRLMLAEDRNRSVFGEVDSPTRPSTWLSLQSRLDSVPSDGFGVDRLDDISTLKKKFDQQHLLDPKYQNIKDDVTKIQGRLSAAEKEIGNIS